MCCTALHCPPLAASIYAQLEAGPLDLQLVLWTRPKWALGWWFLVGNPIGTPEKEPPRSPTLLLDCNFYLPVVPQKAVAEVSEIGNLYRRGWLL